MKKQINEVKRLRQLAGLLKENTSDFSLDELDDFLMDNSLGSEEEILKALPGWEGGSLEDNGYDTVDAIQGIKKQYRLEPLWVIEVKDEGGNGAVRVEKFIPLDPKEKKPSVYLVTLLFSSNREIDWNAVMPLIRQKPLSVLAPFPGLGGNSFILPQQYEAALETMVQGGAAGTVSERSTY